MKAVVVLSGGQDSATCLALAIRKHGAENVAAITFAYGQRHAIETKFAKRLTRLVPEAVGASCSAGAGMPPPHWQQPPRGGGIPDSAKTEIVLHKIVRLGFYKHLTTNALLDPTLKIRVQGQRSKVKGQTAESNLLCLTSDLGPLTSSSDLGPLTSPPRPSPPNTVVEGRNAIFLQHAAVWAKTLAATDVYTGVSEADFSGYPDCRAAFIRAEEKAIRLALDYPIRIVTPFMHMTKADEWALAAKLGIFDVIRNDTVTCYNGIPGDGCGKCPACQLRNRGLKEYLKKAKVSGEGEERKSHSSSGSTSKGRRHSCLRSK